MLEIIIPGMGDIQLKHLVCDFSGTLSVDGVLVDGVAERMKKLAEHLEIHVITADTHGTAKIALEGIDCTVEFIDSKYQDMYKEKYIERFHAHSVVAVGNGNNDRMMLRTARIGIAVCLAEGMAVEAARNADIVARSINDALDLLLYPKRLIATLRV